MPSERKERLAINLFDLDRIDPVTREKLLKNRLDLSSSVEVEFDRMQRTRAVVFTCDLLVAATILDILRTRDLKEGDAPFRCYICKDTAWARILNTTVLTIKAGGDKFMLNPAVFPPDVHPSDLHAPPVVPVKLGG